MFNTPLKFQFTIFGMFNDITPNSENLAYLISAYSSWSLVPSIFSDITINQDLINQQTVNKSNVKARDSIRMKSIDGIWDITIKSNRVDINKVNQNLMTKDIGTIEEFISEARKLYECINNKYEKKFNRIAIVTNYLSDEISSFQHQEIFTKSFNPIHLFIESPPYDWSNKISTTLKRKIVNDDELNILVTFNRTKGEIGGEPTDRTELKIDINTTHLNQDYRFDNSSILPFFEIAVPLEIDIKNKYNNYFQ